MKFVFGIILLISLSFQIEQKDFSIPFQSQIKNQIPTFNINLGSETNNLVVSLYYPCIIYDSKKGSSTYSIPESAQKVPITPFLSSSSMDGIVMEDKLMIQDEASSRQTDQLNFLYFDKSIVKDDHNEVGYFGLAPLTSSNELKQYITLDLLQQKGIITNTLFSIGNIQWNTDGSYKGILTLGKKHADFQTTKGKSVTCTDKSDYFWGCNFKSLKYNRASMNFNSDSKVILITEDIYAYLDYDKYYTDFKKLFPEGSDCQEKEGSGYYYYQCNSWSTKEMPIKLSFKLDKDEFNLVLDIPDENDLKGEKRKHYEFTPSVHFVKGLNDAFLPMIWFKDFHVLFSKETNGKSSIIFHANDETLIETVGEEVIDKSNYIMISKVAFIFLCISCGIVLIFIVLFIGYIRLTNKKNTRGIQTNKGKKGTGAYRMATFDSSLLGTCSDSMPKKMKTSV